jgi:hypothetical protein
VVQEEPESFLGPEIKGQLAAIGIEKGKPFAPDDRMKKILIDAAAIGNAAARAISYSPRHPGLYTYGKDSGWYRPIISGDTTYTQNGARVLDGRVFYHFGYICVSPAMATKAAGKGSDYSMGMVDSKGRPLDGSKTYRLRMPPDIPVKDFWALTMYDTQTRCQLQTDQRFPHPRQLPRGHEEERRRLHRRLLLAEGAEGSGEQLAADDPGQGLVRRAAHVRPAPALARPDLATRRDRAGGVMFPRITFQES